MTRNKRTRNGFSLIELIIVIAILGILTGIIVVNAGAFTHPAKARAWNSSMQSLKEALMSYAATIGADHYPTNPSGEVNAWLNSVKVSQFLDKPIVNPFWPNAKVGISSSVAVAVDQPTDPGTTDPVNWIQYTTSDITDIDGNSVTNGKFTITYMIGTKTYTLTNTGPST